jgi:hypothetical protein
LDKDLWQKKEMHYWTFFLTVWNKGHGRAKQQIEKLQEELEETKAAATTTNTTISKKQWA